MHLMWATHTLALLGACSAQTPAPSHQQTLIAMGGSWDTSPCRMTGVTVHSHIRYRDIGSHALRTFYTGLYPQSEP